MWFFIMWCWKGWRRTKGHFNIIIFVVAVYIIYISLSLFAFSTSSFNELFIREMMQGWSFCDRWFSTFFPNLFSFSFSPFLVLVRCEVVVDFLLFVKYEFVKWNSEFYTRSVVLPGTRWSLLIKIFRLKSDETALNSIYFKS